MSEDNAVKSIVLPLFSGKNTDYSVFWPRFYTYAVLKGLEEELDATTSKFPADPSVLDSDADIKKAQEKATKMNNLAIASFTMAFITGTLMVHVEKTKTNEYPGGVACKEKR